ncbi:MAG: TSUP family transporter [bacterium]
METMLAWWALLVAVTALGAVSQAAVGLGFSLLTLPFYLLLLEVRDAVQLAMILTIAITAAMLPRVWRDVPRRTARDLLLGSLLGFPLGLAFFLHASAAAIQVAVAATILIALGATAIKTRRSMHDVHDDVAIKTRHSTHDAHDAHDDTAIKTQHSTPAALTATRADFPAVAAGVLSGAMNAAIAMAGPAIAIYLQAVGAGKATVRATIFFVYAFSYVAALALQGYFDGIGAGALNASLYLLPVALLGAHLGDRLSARLSERVFARIISCVLIVVALYLLYSAL